MKLIALELFKLRTQRAITIILLSAFVLAILGFVGLAISISVGALPPQAGIALTDAGTQRQLLSAGGGTILIIVFAILGITSEYRHKTITGTFLGVPARSRVLLAKLAAYMLVAIAYGVVLASILTGGVLILLSIENVVLVVPWGQILSDYARDLVSIAMMAAWGFGIGALLANQVGAIIVVLAEPVASSILTGLLPNVGKWTPNQAANAFANESDFLGGIPGMLSRGTAGLVFLGYIVLTVGLGIYVTQRRDIT
ncbi:MAG: type transport system permease protein [Actinomycetota bacterium]|jgi:hypothetical protein|nr:type transport system permease protein [Actinomycetota bacterium]